jgi:peroxiredoxin Q/BCP
MLKLSALNIDDNVPNFEAINSNEKLWKFENFRNKKYVLIFFYPAAMTGGCTKQVCSYRDSHDQWKNENVEIVGISGDQVKNLTLFRKAEKIPFTLLSDPERKNS